MKKLCLLFILVLVISNLSAQDIIITSQPISIRECVGNTAFLSVSAYSLSDKTISFQWYKDDKVINGERSPIIKFQSLQHNQSGSYYCRVTSEETSESVNSNLAAVYALRPTSITKEPEDILTDSESDMVSLSFDAHVSGFGIEDAIQNGEFVKIQWYRVIDKIKNKLNNNEIYDGVNSNKLNINTANLPDTTYYFAEIEGKCSIASTRIVKVIKSLKLIELTISGLDACEGNIESIKAQIKNPQNHKLEFQWYKDGKPIYYNENLKGIYSDELIFNPILVENSGKYKIEAKIKEINYSVFSNEVDINVGKVPKIVCFRLTENFGYIIYNFPPDWMKGYFNVDIFFEENHLPITFEIYRDGTLLATYLSTESRFSLGNTFYLRHDEYFKDSLEYWVVASNECGIIYSDTISFHNQNYCDPFNQFQQLCSEDKLVFEITYHPKDDKLYFFEWEYHQLTKGIYFWYANSDNKYSNTSKLEVNDLNGFNIPMRYGTVFDFNYGLFQFVVRNSKDGIEDVFFDFHPKVKYSPEILHQPINKSIIYNYGVKETLFRIIFDNEQQKTINLSLYYLETLDSKPELIEKTTVEYGMWYQYIKEVTFTDAGYYYALFEYPNDTIIDYECPLISSDTIKVTIIPKGIISGVNEVKSAISIYPNPSSDFINISVDNDAVLHSREVQILNLLGLVVSKQELRDGNNRIDISDLPRGTYFIKIGDKVEKFVKM